MSGAWSISWLYQPLFSGASPANTTSGRWARTAAGSAVINCVTPGPHVTVATPTSRFFREYAMAAGSAVESVVKVVDELQRRGSQFVCGDVVKRGNSQRIEPASHELRVSGCVDANAAGFAEAIREARA